MDTKEFQKLASNAQNMFAKQREQLNKDLDFLLNDNKETSENKHLVKSLVDRLDEAINNNDKDSLNILKDEVLQKLNR
jgi:N-acetylglucosamine kinase-like BadF-type ATPase